MESKPPKKRIGDGSGFSYVGAMFFIKERDREKERKRKTKEAQKNNWTWGGGALLEKKRRERVDGWP